MLQFRSTNNKMQNIKNIIGVAIALLLLSFVPSVSAQPIVHQTYSEVVNTFDGLSQTNRNVPDPIFEAYFMGSGITWYAGGGYVLDCDTSISGAVQAATYDAIIAATGDPVLAAEGALGLLTPAELRRAQGQDEFGGGSWGSLYTFYGVFGYAYTYQGGGGGGYLN